MSLLRAAVVVVASAVVAGCGGDGGDAGAVEAPAVEVKTFMFSPDPVEVPAGEAVTWTNRDSAVHTVTSDRFDERLAESGGTATVTFDSPGRYRYVCSLHSGPGMKGVVIVR